jgi:DNA repair exonuclease SbcCD ATPase subunit
MASLSLSIIEIIVLMLGAITLGITIHFFIISRHGMKSSPMETEKVSKNLEEWKLRYFNDTELRDKELVSLKKRLEESEENNTINSIEADEMRKLNKKLKSEIEALQKITPSGEKEKPDYIQQLRQAQSSLMEHNEKINHLLGQIDIAKETEEKQQEMLKVNEELSGQIDDLRSMLSQKEKEIHNTRQKEHLTNEMTSMIDSAYNEFNVLQDKIQKLESQVNASKKINLEYEDLKEGNYRISQDFEEQKRKYSAAISENKQLLEELTETEDKLKEANFQRQQLQKKVGYLEELNNDMQEVADANKKLEGQLKRIGELESMLNVVAEERDDLARKQFNI